MVDTVTNFRRFNPNLRHYVGLIMLEEGEVKRREHREDVKVALTLKI